MTESEAIKELHKIRPRCGIIPQKRAEAIDVAINALEEIEQYKALGTVNELRLAKEKQIPKKIEIRKATNDDIESELRDFITVKGRICRCPSCRCCIHISELKYCWECGQKLNWESDE